MIIEIGIGLVIVATAYFVGTKSGKAELALVKAKLAEALPAIEKTVATIEAKAKADVLAIIADLKKL